MKIKMLQSIPGALNDGLNIHLFKKDLIYPNNEIKDLEGLDKIFLDNKFAEVYVVPEEVIRHQNGLTGAPIDKREKDPEENKKKVIYTSEELEGAKAGDIRKLADENGIDISDLKVNISGKKLIPIYLERQGK